MKSSGADHRTQWQPPPRPEWVQRVNEEGYCMNVRAVVPLDAQSLLDCAMRTTGLEDFGADDWQEPFEKLAHAMDEEADLNLIGRLRTRSELLQLLEARLRIEATYKEHPEIENERIVQPIIIVGQGRSGTTFLNNLLAANPDNGALMQWEATFPCPPPEAATYRTDTRIERAHKLIDQWNRVTPTLPSMHDFSGSVPMEDCQIIALNFTAPSWFGSLGQVASYDAYIATLDAARVLSYHQRVLKLLQWKNPRRHWVLKDPIHLDRLQALLRIYPDACFVWPHRDPVRALASMVDLIGTIQWGRSDHPFKDGAFDFVVDPVLSARRLNAAIEVIESGVVPKRQFHNLLYADLVRDPLGAVRKMYAHFGIPLSERGIEGMAAYLRERPREARPVHHFSAGSPEATARARDAYRRYQDHFHIPSE